MLLTQKDDAVRLFEENQNAQAELRAQVELAKTELQEVTDQKATLEAQLQLINA